MPQSLRDKVRAADLKSPVSSADLREARREHAREGMKEKEKETKKTSPPTIQEIREMKKKAQKLREENAKIRSSTGTPAGRKARSHNPY